MAHVFSRCNMPICSRADFINPEIKLGLPADSVETLVANEVQGHHNAGGYLIKMSAQSITYKGK